MTDPEQTSPPEQDPATLPSPRRCRHEPYDPHRREDEIMDGKGNVVLYHIRCRKCLAILETRKVES